MTEDQMAQLVRGYILGKPALVLEFERRYRTFHAACRLVGRSLSVSSRKVPRP